MTYGVATMVELVRLQATGESFVVLAGTDMPGRVRVQSATGGPIYHAWPGALRLTDGRPFRAAERHLALLPVIERTGERGGACYDYARCRGDSE